MKVIIFGATGMVGRGVLRECLLDPRVSAVLTVGRAPTGISHGKLREIVHGDLLDLAPIEDRLSGFDACFFCLGVSSAGMSEKDYRHVTYDVTMSVANTLARLNPGSTFTYVSGVGTDAHGRAMWARVKGETENALLALPLEAYMFRPGYIQPMHGVRSRTRIYRVAYVVARPLYPLLRMLFPGAVTTTERIGQAMITVAERGAPKRILGPSDINSL
ncbi:NAD-dependent epimerase/dehydratase family protein [Nonomuraea sp. SYSU D8015]|uniref:NAD-dependent epimerase/dehydratase family protein n=1 Tax=Nonomuraea sp. SYSU D8015 TaxID=2593644 RepID=UPI0016617681|nr:NAD-dependent epimerase/dehydratase family protein [Nonomuraea sp. SYSU D8015]